MGGKGGGKKGPDWGQIFTWAADFAYQSWQALKGFWQVITPLISTLKDLWGYVVKVYDWVKAFVQPIWNFYTDYIKPWLDWVRGALEIMRNIILLTQGRLEELIKTVYSDIFADFEVIRKDIQNIFGTVKDIVSVFSADLTNKIQATEDKFFRTLDSFSRDIRDELINKLYEVTDPILHKINELTLVIEGYLKLIAQRFEGIERLINITFEKPGLLSRETVDLTGLVYGTELMEATFSGSTPALTEEEAAGIPFERLPQWLEEARDNISLGETGEWADVEKRLTEEMVELITQRKMLKKTELVISGPIGGF